MVCQTCTCRGHMASTFCKWAAAWRTAFPKQRLIGCMIRQWGLWGLARWKVTWQYEGNHMTQQAHRNHVQQQLYQQGASMLHSKLVVTLITCWTSGSSLPRIEFRHLEGKFVTLGCFRKFPQTSSLKQSAIFLQIILHHTAIKKKEANHHLNCKRYRTLQGLSKTRTPSCMSLLAIYSPNSQIFIRKSNIGAV